MPFENNDFANIRSDINRLATGYCTAPDKRLKETKRLNLALLDKYEKMIYNKIYYLLKNNVFCSNNSNNQRIRAEIGDFELSYVIRTNLKEFIPKYWENDFCELINWCYESIDYKVNKCYSIYLELLKRGEIDEQDRDWFFEIIWKEFQSDMYTSEHGKHRLDQLGYSSHDGSGRLHDIIKQCFNNYLSEKDEGRGLYGYITKNLHGSLKNSKNNERKWNGGETIPIDPKDDDGGEDGSLPLIQTVAGMAPDPAEAAEGKSGVEYIFKVLNEIVKEDYYKQSDKNAWRTGYFYTEYITRRLKKIRMDISAHEAGQKVILKEFDKEFANSFLMVSSLDELCSARKIMDAAFYPLSKFLTSENGFGKRESETRIGEDEAKEKKALEGVRCGFNKDGNIDEYVFIEQIRRRGKGKLTAPITIRSNRADFNKLIKTMKVKPNDSDYSAPKQRKEWIYVGNKK